METKSESEDEEIPPLGEAIDEDVEAYDLEGETLVLR